MDFLATCVWIWEFLVLFLLPTVSILMTVVFLLKLSDEIPKTILRTINRLMSKFNLRR